MRGKPGGQAEGCLVTVRLASGGVASLTGTEAVEEHPEELQLATRRECRPRPGWNCPWPSSEALHCPLQYLLQVQAQNTRGEDYTEPLELHVVVADENDNAPVCPLSDSPVSIPELSPPGGLWALWGDAGGLKSS